MTPSPKRKLSPQSHQRQLTADDVLAIFNSQFDARVAKMRSRHIESRTGHSNKAANAWLTPRMDLRYCFDNNPRGIASIELPGLRKDEINLRVEGRELIVQGERRSRNPFIPTSAVIAKPGPALDTQNNLEVVEVSMAPGVQELKYGKFRRIIPLPAGVQPGHINAILSDGILAVTWPVPQTSPALGSETLSCTARLLEHATNALNGDRATAPRSHAEGTADDDSTISNSVDARTTYTLGQGKDLDRASTPLEPIDLEMTPLPTAGITSPNEDG